MKGIRLQKLDILTLLDPAVISMSAHDAGEEKRRKKSFGYIK